MIFRCFSFEADDYGCDSGSAKVNGFISSHEEKGYDVVDRLVTNSGQGHNSLIRPVITVSVWMDKRR